MKHDRLLDDLGDLAVPAPDSLLPRVLVGTGIVDGYVRRTSVLGDLLVAFGANGVTAVELAGDPGEFVTRYERRFGRRAIPVDRMPPTIARHLDTAIIEGRPGRLPVDLDRLTAFQAAVLRAAATIPRGEVRPYGWVAKEIGKPGAVRAVGTALASNPVPLIIPCHRVVRSDGTLGDYSLGEPENKRTLLEFEGLDTGTFEALAASGVRFTGSDTTGIFCHPTCRHARRAGAAHRVDFASEQEARSSGYRPCKVCRPVAA
ncbi:MAG TPA: methylated-DNA--[protein]-cysteine S-methyltransferase [Acidimicrobiia bacterium]|nr:methylated-DNA--[protein]-cysteine S-methyltransferase [Acidimicrobiia bacterium]HLE38319.1 methylated-DNA--[protein]-cysteine S-methyltransferase [Acidimicrobiia bacterium]